MNILLINVPSRKGKGSLEMPAGLLYAGSAIKRSGYRVKIIDLYLYDFSDLDQGNEKLDFVDKVISEFDPAVVGFGGIATSYGRVKRLSEYIKRANPEITQIAGGALSSVYDLLLKNTRVDVIFYKEAEVNLVNFLDSLKNNKSFNNIEGISYREGENIKVNSSLEQVKDLDDIPFPDYSLLDTKRYLHSMNDWIKDSGIVLQNNPDYDRIVSKVKNKMYMPIYSSRGCINKCSFCYRHLDGHRQHSVKYVINHIKYLKEIFGLDGFQFCDELFNARIDWIMDFCDALDQERLNIFYMIGGARVARVNEFMLKRLKEAGCVEIAYGHESGSDVILKEYKKGATTQQNINITNLSVSAGMNSPVQLVIGSPGENNLTIRESINFLKSVNAYTYSLNYLIPLPQAPIWKFVEEKNLVDNTEKYLDLVADSGGVPLVNLTKEPDKMWKSWGPLIRKEMRLYYYKKTKPILYLVYKIFIKIRYLLAQIAPVWVKRLVPGFLKSKF